MVDVEKYLRQASAADAERDSLRKYDLANKAIKDAAFADSERAGATTIAPAAPAPINTIDIITSGNFGADSEASKPAMNLTTADGLTKPHGMTSEGMAASSKQYATELQNDLTKYETDAGVARSKANSAKSAAERATLLEKAGNYEQKAEELRGKLGSLGKVDQTNFVQRAGKFIDDAANLTSTISTNFLPNLLDTIDANLSKGIDRKYAQQMVDAENAEVGKAYADAMEGRNKAGQIAMQGVGAAANLISAGAWGMATGLTPALNALAPVGSRLAATEATLGAGKNASALAKGTRMVGNIMAKSSGGNAIISFSSAMNKMNEAYKNGADDYTASVAGFSAGLLEYMSNMLGGMAIENNPLAKTYIGELSEHIAKKVSASPMFVKAFKGIMDLNGEGLEEVITAIGEPIIDKLTFNPEADFATIDEIVDAYLGGVTLAAIMNGGNAIANTAMNSRQANQPDFSMLFEQGKIKPQSEAQTQTSTDMAEMQNAPSAEFNAETAQNKPYNSIVKNNAQSVDNALSENAIDNKNGADRAETGRTLHTMLEEEAADATTDIDNTISANDGGVNKQRDDFLEKYNRDVERYNSLLEEYGNENTSPERLKEVVAEISPLLDSLLERKDRATQLEREIKGKVSFNYNEPESHIDNREFDNVGNRKLKSFQFDHPELHQYYVEAAKALHDMISLGTKGEAGSIKIESMDGGFIHDEYQRYGMKRTMPDEVVELLDDAKVSYDQINKSIEAIINDEGQENFAAAKKVEIVLDEMLTNGFSIFGEYVEPNQDYINAKSKIIGGSEISAQEDMANSLDGLGAMDARQGEARTSRIAETAEAYDPNKGIAAGVQRKNWRDIFKYNAQSEAQSQQRADNMLYVMEGGEKKFLLDFDPDAFADVVAELKDAPAWNAVMVDAANMIETELERRSLESEITSEEYQEWLGIMRDHSVATAQGEQAWAKWSRTDMSRANDKLDALENIDNSNLSDADKMQLKKDVIRYNNEIREAKTTNELADKIMEIAAQRGSLNGISGKQAKLLTAAARSTLNGLTVDELRNLAYGSVEAMTMDNQPKDVGKVLKTIQILNMLSSPKTAATNIAGNSTFHGIDYISMNGAALMDIAISKLTGTRSVAAEKFIGSKDIRNAIAKSCKLSAAEILLDVDMGASGKYDTHGSYTFKSSGNILERAMHIVERNNNFLMKFTDEAFKGASRGTKEATQRLIDSGKIKTENENYASEQAEALSKYRTFQSNSELSGLLQTAHDALNKFGIGDSGRVSRTTGKKIHAFGAGDLVAPFTKVAGNLFSVGVDYSPIKAIQGTVEIANAVANAKRGNADAKAQAKAVSDFARGMTGTAITLAFYALASAGFIRRHDDDDPDVRKMQEAEGLTGTQFNISAAARALTGGDATWKANDKLLDFSRIEPFSYLLNLGVQLSEADDAESISSFGMDLANSLGESLANTAEDLPVLSTYGNIVNGMRYGDTATEAIAKSLGKTLISSATPNWLAALAKGTDEYQRDLYTKDSVAGEIADYALGRIPGARESLPTKVGIDGNPAKNNQSLFDALVNPVGVRTNMQTEQSAALESLYSETGKSSVYPDYKAKTEITNNKHVIELTKEQQAKYQQVYSKKWNEYESALINSNSYKNASAEEKVELQSKIKAQAAADAKSAILGSRENISLRNSEIGKLPAQQYITYNEYADAFNALTDDDGATASDIRAFDSLMARYDNVPPKVKEIIEGTPDYDGLLDWHNLRDANLAGVSTKSYYSMKDSFADALTEKKTNEQAAGNQNYRNTSLTNTEKRNTILSTDLSYSDKKYFVLDSCSSSERGKDGTTQRQRAETAINTYTLDEVVKVMNAKDSYTKESTGYKTCASYLKSVYGGNADAIYNIIYK